MSEFVVVPKEEFQALVSKVDFLIELNQTRSPLKDWLSHKEAVQFLSGLIKTSTLHSKAKLWESIGAIRRIGEGSNARKMYSRQFLQMIKDDNEATAIELFQLI